MKSQRNDLPAGSTKFQEVSGRLHVPANKEESESLRSQFATSQIGRERMRSQCAISKKLASTRGAGDSIKPEA